MIGVVVLVSFGHQEIINMRSANSVNNACLLSQYIEHMNVLYLDVE